MNLLYHCFPRQKNRIEPGTEPIGDCIRESIEILESIFDNGILLTHENVILPTHWRDPYGDALASDLEIQQFRFCLTYLQDDNELYQHSKLFGRVGVAFNIDFVRKIGGVPVFYLPAPVNQIANDELDKVGISLIYRLAEMREVLETIDNLPTLHQKILKQKVADFDNLKGALRFIGNILYLTDSLHQKHSSKLFYYKQLEWRVIAGLCPVNVKTKEMYYKGETLCYAISEWDNKPISSFIEEIVVVGDPDLESQIGSLLSKRGYKVPIRSICVSEKGGVTYGKT